MDFIKGDDRILYIDVLGTYVPLGCLTSNPMTEEVDMIKTTTRENNGWETSLPTTQRFSIDFEGLQMLTLGDIGDASKLSYDSLKTIKRNREKVLWKIADLQERFIDTGSGYITSLSESNQVGEFLGFSGSIVGFGEPIASTGVGDYLFEDGQVYTFEDGQVYLFD